MEDNSKLSTQELWALYFASPSQAIKNDLVMRYLPIVHYIVNRLMPLRGSGNTHDDLVGYGVIGLIDAVDRFDPERGIKFEAFAAKRIKGEILDNMRRQDWASASLRSRIKQLNDAYDEMELNQQDTSDEAVAQKLGLTVEQVQKALEKAYIFNIVRFESLSMAADETGIRREELIPEDEDRSPEKVLDRKEMREIIKREISHMTPNEQKVVVLYYYEELMLKEIAQVLGVTSARVSQIHSKALMKLRAGLEKSLYGKTLE